MESHTLTEEQSKELSTALALHILNGMPVGEPGKTLLEKLQRIEPNQGKWAILYTNPGEEEIFQALVNSHWGRKEESNDAN